MTVSLKMMSSSIPRNVLIFGNTSLCYSSFSNAISVQYQKLKATSNFSSYSMNTIFMMYQIFFRKKSGFRMAFMFLEFI